MSAHLTILTPVFNESETIERYVETVTSVLLGQEDVTASILFIDDGSTDDSWKKICAAAERDPRFTGLRLSRNFGSHVALTAGFDNVPGNADIVATLACDLQDPADVVLRFVEGWRRGADIVWGARRQRHDAWWKVAASRMLGHMLRRHAMPRGSRFQTGSFFLINRKVLDCLLRYREHNRITFALVAWSGFDQDVVEYDRTHRVGGRSGWSLGRMVQSAYDVFIGFSPLPARFITLLGFVVSFLSLLAMIYIVVVWITTEVQPGWTGIMAAMTVLFGIVFMMLGLMTEYLYRIFIESKNRPLYFVSKRTGP